jgi:hypothetical protein
MKDGHRGGFCAITVIVASLMMAMSLDSVHGGESASPDQPPSGVASTKTTSAPNLVVNPGFEDGAVGWTEKPISFFSGTSFWWSNAGGTVHSGSRGYTISDLAWGHLRSDLIEVIPSTDYDLYVHVKGELDSDESLRGVLVRVNFYDSNGVHIWYKDVYRDFSASVPTGTWQRVGGRATAPSNAAHARIRLYNYLGSGWIAFDDVEFFNVNNPGVNLAVNPGFENGAEGWTETPFAKFPGTSFWRSPLGPTRRSGSYGYMISNLAYGHLASVYIDLDPDTAPQTYDLHVWVKGELDPGESLSGLLFRAYFYDAAKAYISNQTVYQDTTGGNLTENWQRVGGQVTSPVGTRYVRIRLYNYLGSGWIAFDDVELVNPNNPGVNLVVNPGFENGAEGWMESPFAKFPGTAFWRTNYRFPTPHSGDFDYTISNLAYGHLQSDPIPVYPSTEYDLYTWVNGELDADETLRGLLIRAYFYNAAGGYIGNQTAFRDYTVSVPSGTWQRVGGTITTPAEAESVRIWLYNHLASGWIAFDDVEFTMAMANPPPPLFSLTGLRYRAGADWLPLGELPFPIDAELAVMTTNIGDGAGVVTAQATVRITGPGCESATLTGAATLSLAPGESGYVALSPNWQANTFGNYRLLVGATLNQLSLSQAWGIHFSPGQPECSTTLILPTDLVE